jgi:outer membrane cobalamin receptor
MLTPRYPERIDALTSVTIIPRDDIEQRQVNSADESLRGEAGISISNVALPTF